MTDPIIPASASIGRMDADGARRSELDGLRVVTDADSTKPSRAESAIWPTRRIGTSAQPRVSLHC